MLVSSEPCDRHHVYTTSILGIVTLIIRAMVAKAKDVHSSSLRAADCHGIASGNWQRQPRSQGPTLCIATGLHTPTLITSWI